MDSTYDNPLKKHCRQHCVMLKVKGMSGHVTQVQKNVEPFLASADYLFQKAIQSEKNVKFAGKASSADQKTTKKMFKYLLRIIQEKSYGEKQVSRPMRLISFTRTLENEPI